MISSDKKNKTILIKNADYLVTMDKKKRVLRGASVYIEGHQIKEVDSQRKKADQVIDASGRLVLPGFINTHHHLFQAFLRHVPEFQNQPIDQQISILCQFTKKMNAEAHYYAALVNIIELLLSGCTTTTDMLYIFPNEYNHQELFGATVEAAQDVGVRFHPFRGSISVGKKDGALFDNDVVESSTEIVERTSEVIQHFHQTEREAMVKVGIAPCTIFSSTREDYRNAAELAKKFDVNLQTHLSETQFEQKYARQRFGTTPLEYLQKSGWHEARASFVHCLEVDERSIALLKKYNQSVCYCPISNSRGPIGQKGIGPIWEMLKAGVKVAVGVDGSAGNDSSNILEEMRWAKTIQGARVEATYLQPMDVLYMGTMGGAKALRWDDMLGSIEVGKCADIAIFNIYDSIGYVGVWNPVGSLISCQAERVETLVVNGKVIIQNGKLQTMNEKEVIKNAWKRWKETFIGGKGKNRAFEWDGNERPKEVVMGIIERGGKAHLEHIPNTGKWTLLKEIKDHVEPNSRVITDDYYGYTSLPQYGYTHDFVNHRETYVVGDIHTQNAESIWSTLKRGIYGVYRVVSKKYLQNYVDEYAWRYNHRCNPGNMFDCLLKAIVGVRPVKVELPV